MFGWSTLQFFCFLFLAIWNDIRHRNNFQRERLQGRSICKNIYMLYWSLFIQGSKVGRCVILIIIILTSIFFQDQSRVWTAASQQHKVDNKPLAFSLKAVVYHWEYWNRVLVTRCSSWRQPARFREETLESGNLFSSSWILPPYQQCNKIYMLYWALFIQGSKVGQYVIIFICFAELCFTVYTNLLIYYHSFDTSVYLSNWNGPELALHRMSLGSEPWYLNMLRDQESLYFDPVSQRLDLD